MSLELGYGNFYFFKFTDANFTREVSPAAILQADQKVRADDNIGDVLKKETKTVILAGGGKHVVTQPNEESANLRVTVLNPLSDALLNIAFVDSIKTVDGTKEKREYFDRIGIDLADWTNSVATIFRPTDAQGNEVAANLWIVLPHSVIVPVRESERGKDESVTELNILSLGGATEGAVATFLTTVDFAGGIDFSTGNNKAIKIIIDGTIKDNIDLGNNASTQALDVVNAINAAFGDLVTAEEAGPSAEEFIRFNGALANDVYGEVQIDDPTDTVSFDTALALAFNATAVDEDATSPVPIPVKIEGDETAV